MTLLMTFKPDQSLNQATDQTGIDQSLDDQLTDLPLNPEQEEVGEINGCGKIAEGFEPEFDGQLKNMSWAHLKLFEKSEDF